MRPITVLVNQIMIHRMMLIEDATFNSTAGEHV